MNFFRPWFLELFVLPDEFSLIAVARVLFMGSGLIGLVGLAAGGWTRTYILDGFHTALGRTQQLPGQKSMRWWLEPLCVHGMVWAVFYSVFDLDFILSRLVVIETELTTRAAMPEFHAAWNHVEVRKHFLWVRYPLYLGVTFWGPLFVLSYYPLVRFEREKWSLKKIALCHAIHITATTVTAYFLLAQMGELQNKVCPLVCFAGLHALVIVLSIFPVSAIGCIGTGAFFGYQLFGCLSYPEEVGQAISFMFAISYIGFLWAIHVSTCEQMYRER